MSTLALLAASLFVAANDPAVWTEHTPCPHTPVVRYAPTVVQDPERPWFHRTGMWDPAEPCVVHVATQGRSLEEVCNDLAHELLHAAGFREPGNTVDPMHSADPRSVMNAESGLNYLPCRAFRITPRVPTRREDAMTMAREVAGGRRLQCTRWRRETRRCRTRGGLRLLVFARRGDVKVELFERTKR